MSKKLCFGVWLLGLLFSLVAGIIPVKAADTYVCKCFWTDYFRSSQIISADTAADCQAKCNEVGATATWSPEGTLPTTTVGSQPQTNSQTVHLSNPLGTVTSPQVLIGQIINSVLGIVGSIALLMFVFGGITWMTSGGSQEKVKKGRDIIVWSALGLAVIFMSYALTRFVLSTIVK
jgi:hypothetical protein